MTDPGQRRDAGTVPDEMTASPRTSPRTSTSDTDGQRPLAARSPFAIHKPDRQWTIPTRPPGTDCLSGILATFWPPSSIARLVVYQQHLSHRPAAGSRCAAAAAVVVVVLHQLLRVLPPFASLSPSLWSAHPQHPAPSIQHPASSTHTIHTHTRPGRCPWRGTPWQMDAGQGKQSKLHPREDMEMVSIKRDQKFTNVRPYQPQSNTACSTTPVVCISSVPPISPQA